MKFKLRLPWKTNKDEGLSSSQVKTLMAHIGTMTSICMVQPMGDTSSEECKKLRNSLKQREYVWLNRNSRYAALESNNNEEDDKTKYSYSKKNPIKRISNILEPPSNLIEYKDVIRSLSTQMFPKKRTPRSGPRFSIVPPVQSDYQGLMDEEYDSDDDRTMNFVLTQKFIGWKV